MKWEKVKFSTLFSEPTRNGVYKAADFHGFGVKIVNMGELFAYDFINSQPMHRIIMSKEEMSVNGLKEADLLFARRSLVEEGAGKVSIVGKLDEETTFESSIIRVRLNKAKCLPLFYFYWMKSHAGRAAVGALVSGTNVKGIRASELKNIVVDYPGLPTQHRITSILSAYDNLIGVNQKQIKLLEEAARRLYKEWFVDLRFPGYEDASIVDGMPDGWSKCLLSAIANVNEENIPKGYKYDYIDYIDLNSVRRGHIKSKTQYLLKDAPGRAKRKARDGDIIWGMVRPNLCSYALVLNPADTTVFSTGFAVISPKTVPFTYLYCTVTHKDFVGYLVNATNGTAYPAVKSSDFEQAKILKPAEEILVKFHHVTEPIFRKIEDLDRQSKELAEARDRLLPKLMSGELEV